MVEKVILKFNAAVGTDPLPKIREITSELQLRVDEVADDKPASGRKLKIVTISGEPKGLFELAKRLRRVPSVTVKIA